MASKTEFNRSNKLFGRASVPQSERMLIVVCKKCKMNRRLLKKDGSKISKFWKCGDAGLRELDSDLNYGDRGLYECGKFPSADLAEIFGYEQRFKPKEGGEVVEHGGGEREEGAKEKKEGGDQLGQESEVDQIEEFNVESFHATSRQENLQDDVGGISFTTLFTRANNETMLARSKQVRFVCVCVCVAFF